MRLTGQEIHVIKSTILTLDPHAKVYLFGSRTDDSKRGGDIDLLVISDCLSDQDKTKIRIPLYERLGEQKIDIVFAKPRSRQSFVRVALSKAILL